MIQQSGKFAYLLLMLFRRSDLHQLLYCQYPMVGDIAALVETPNLLADAPFSIEPVFVDWKIRVSL